jgi:arginine:ornithine antiporter/lysine permease
LTVSVSEPVADAPVAAQGGARRLTLLPLAAMVVGSMIGAGTFSLPHDMSAHAAPGPVLIGWSITGIGMLALAFVYQGLAMRKPTLNSGPYAYARAGFGSYIGFQSAWGYWVSAWLGNVSNAVVIFSALAFFFPVFGHGNNLASLIGASVGVWLMHWLVLRGVRQAAFVNMVSTVTRLAPIGVFVVVAVFAFNYDKFTWNFWGIAKGGDVSLGSVADQVRSTMIVTLWGFIGIEGASVLSARAANRADVGRATVIGFLSALTIYVLVSLLSTGVLTQKELAGLTAPSMAGVLASLIGPWGAAVVSVGLVVSVAGAFLSWSMLSAEIPFAAAKDGTFPKWFAKENAAGSPVNALWITNALVQLFLVVTYFRESSYQFLYTIASVAILPPYVFSGAYALELALTGETYEIDSSRRTRDLVTGAVATLYGLWLCYAARLSELLMATILFAPATLIYMAARRERREKLFTPVEAVIAVVFTGAGLVAIYLRATGRLNA